MTPDESQNPDSIIEPTLDPRDDSDDDLWAESSSANAAQGRDESILDVSVEPLQNWPDDDDEEVYDSRDIPGWGIPEGAAGMKPAATTPAPEASAFTAIAPEHSEHNPDELLDEPDSPDLGAAASTTSAGTPNDEEMEGFDPTFLDGAVSSEADASADGSEEGVMDAAPPDDQVSDEAVFEESGAEVVAEETVADEAIAATPSAPLPELHLTESPLAQTHPPEVPLSEEDALKQRIATLKQQEQQLLRSIDDLQATQAHLMQEQLINAQAALGQLVKEGLSELEHRKQTLQIAVEQLERRQERIRNEMRTTFAGASQDLAIRVQGFKDYLVGSLQDLVRTAEELKLAPPVEEPRRAAARERDRDAEEAAPPTPKFAEMGFQEQGRMIRKLLDQYRTSPDYYGPPWQLRRTFEPIHAERVSNWFFAQGGRGAIRTMGSRLQNILIASAIISVMHRMYGDRVRALVLADSPERLGEWRRGLQDCLGISRADFGANEGIVLFEAPEPLAQRADRLVKQKQIPLIIMDESEEVINLSLLQFPFWLAFAIDPMNPMVY